LVKQVGGIDFCIFSKDRPLQLNGLLHSIRKHVTDLTEISITILQKASSPQFSEAYKKAVEDVQINCTIIPETNFFYDLLQIVSTMQSSYCMFLVDDIIFIRSVDFKRLLTSISNTSSVVSLRLAPHIEFSYMLNRAIAKPPFSPFNDELLSWNWCEGDTDWGYPLSLDGHIFRRNEIGTILKYILFKAPNSLENSLQFYNSIFWTRKGICYNKARLINIPANLSQNEYCTNPCGNTSTEQLLKQWHDGYRIDIDAVTEMDNRSVHVPIDLPLLRITR
ncbi:MAG: hypothetical protein JW795_22865, partial [Chitinivibrionales bacterium]|nr:hypothetical protein [Chitinivibrionales bacterium]